jgi:hypothetical protein
MMLALLPTGLDHRAPIESGESGMKQKWTQSGGWCLLGVLIDADLPIVLNGIRKKVEDFSLVGAAWARP